MPQPRSLISSNNNIGARGEKEALMKRITYRTEIQTLPPSQSKGAARSQDYTIRTEWGGCKSHSPPPTPTKKRDTEKDNKALEFTRDATHWFLACLGASAHKARFTENGQQRISQSQCQQMKSTRFLYRWGSVIFSSIIFLLFRYLWTCPYEVNPLAIWSCFSPRYEKPEGGSHSFIYALNPPSHSPHGLPPRTLLSISLMYIYSWINR